MAASQNSVELAAKLEQKLATCDSSEQMLEPAAEFISEVFAVSPSEVALFKLEQDKGILRFLWPERLKKVGFLPMNSLDSLAVRTAKEKKLFVENNFASKRHASVFEHVRLSAEKGAPEPIQKIMSVPIPKGSEIVGVVQVSRKAAEKAHPARPDFSKDDLKTLLELAKIIGGRY